RKFIKANYQEYIAANPNELRSNANVMRLIPAASAEPSPRTPDQFVATQSRDAEQLLWRKTCKECHQMDFSQASQHEGLPRVLPAQITTRWLVHASFNHAPHAALSC